MGLMNILTGGGLRGASGAVREVAEVFRPNSEAAMEREGELNKAALEQYAAEFAAQHKQRTFFDVIADGLNRLVRPVVTLCTLGVLPATIIWPEEAAIGFASLALLPTGYWAILGVIIPFYFGGRMQLKSQDFHKSIAVAAAAAPTVIDNIERLRTALTPNEASDDDVEVAVELADGAAFNGNKAIADWEKESK